MGKRTERTNPRVLITPRVKYFDIAFRLESEKLTEDQADACRAIIDDINRHVDSVDGTEIIMDEDHFCEHCDSRWTEDSDAYNGGCCDEDEKNNPEVV
ncbi:MAG: hypothetical protein ACRBC3_19800 [Burkholderiaceae bacterium]